MSMQACQQTKTRCPFVSDITRNWETPVYAPFYHTNAQHEVISGSTKTNKPWKLLPIFFDATLIPNWSKMWFIQDPVSWRDLCAHSPLPHLSRWSVILHIQTHSHQSAQLAELNWQPIQEAGLPNMQHISQKHDKTKAQFLFIMKA